MPYNLFISHSWAYGDAYEKLCEILDGYSYFTYNNHSIPKDDPIHTNGTDSQLIRAIENKMRGCHVVLIMAGVYSTYSKWIGKEIQIANKFNKPIIGIKPWAQTQVSSVVQNNATVMVGWNGSSIVDAIRELSI